MTKSNSALTHLEFGYYRTEKEKRRKNQEHWRIKHSIFIRSPEGGAA